MADGEQRPAYGEYYAEGYIPESREEFSLRYYLDILRRRFWIVLPVLVVAMILGTIKAFRAPMIYQTTAKILVERHAARVMPFDGMQDYTGWDPGYYRTQADLIRSRVVMEMALEKPGVKELFAGPKAAPEPALRKSLPARALRAVRAVLGTTPAPPSEPWERLRDQIQADIAKDSHFILVRVASVDPMRAALLANAAAAAFEEYHLQKKVEALGDAFMFLQKEKEKEERELQKAEAALQDFREKAKGVSLTASDDDVPALDRLISLNDRLTALQLDRSSVRAQIEVMKEVLSSGDAVAAAEQERLFAIPMIGEDSTLSTIRGALAESQKQMALLSNVYGPEHPQMQKARTEIDLLREQFRDALANAVVSFETRLRMLESEEQQLTAQYEEQKKVALELARESFAFTHLQNAVDRHRKLHDSLVARMMEVDVSSGLVQTNVEVVEKAAVPTYPVTPRRIRGVMVSVFMGLFLGIGLAFLVEKLDDAIKTPEDLKSRLKVPLLGFVPSLPLSKRPTDVSEPAYRATAALREPLSSASEAYRNIRTSLYYASPQSELRVVSVASCTPKEGKTTTAVNLAVVIAQSGKRVLLLDADLHRAMVHRIFGLSGDTGMSNILVGEVDWREAVQQVKFDGQVVDNLDVIAAGPSSPNPAELLGSRRMKDLLASARLQYDWVVIDTPPVLFVSDASVVSAMCDGVVLVVRSGATNATSLSRTKEQLDNIRAKIIGAVLNSMSVSRVGRYYSAYYYHGYSRYAKDYHRSYYGKRDDKRDEDADEDGGAKA